MAVVIGEAAVAIRADASGTADDIQTKTGPAAESAGKDAGDRFADKMALGIAGAAVAIGAGFSAALDQAALGDKLAAQLGLTEQRSAQVGAVAGDLYANAYGDSMETVNDAVGAVMSSIGGMATASSADLEAVTGTALNFATAFDQDVGSAATTAGNLIRTGLADNATQAFDLMTAAYQKVPAAMREELPDILNEYGTNFAALGFSGEQAFGMLTAAADGGAIVLDKTGDALKEFSIRGTDMSASSVAAYKAIGLSADDMAAALLSGGDKAAGATQEIAQGLLNIDDPVQRANASIALFGTPLEDLGVNKIPSFLTALASGEGSMDGFSGASDRMGQTLNDNASTNMTTFMRSAQQTFVDVLGGQVIPAVESAATWLNTNLGPAVTAVGGFLTDDLGPPLRALVGWLGDNQGVAQALAGVVGGSLLLAFTAWGTAATINAVKNVIAWFTTATAAQGSAAAQGRSAAQVAFGWIAMGAQALIQGIKIAAVWTAQIVASAVTGAAGFAAQVARVVGGWVLMGAQALIQGIKVAAVWTAQIVASAAVGAAGFLISVATVVAGWVLMGAQAMFAALRMAAAWLIALGPIGIVIAVVAGLVALVIANWETVRAATVAAWAAVTGALSAAWEWIKGVVSAGISFLVGLFMNFTLPGLIISHWETIKSVFSNGIAAVVGFMTSLPGRIVSAVGNLGSLLVGAGRSLMQGFVNGISNAASFVGGAAKNIVNAVIRFVNDRLIGSLNNLLHFTIAGVTVDAPDIPRIPSLHEGGVFSTGGGEGLALLRDGELVVTPEQRTIADNLLRDLLGGSLAPATAAGGAGAAPVTVTNNVTQLPGESGLTLAARVTQGTVWNLNHRITRRTGDAAVEPAR